MAQPKVTIEQGTLRGSLGTDLNGQSFFKFQGIPYAKPPIGELRFKAPVPAGRWTGVFDATKEGGMCYSRILHQPEVIKGGEDCLFINVFTKHLPDGEEGLRPVLVWVHGGGFFVGSGNEDLYGADFLITEDVVVVTFNYRLGMLDFLNFEDPSLEIPGNAGLKDMILALKWVQKNISKFGGDPSNVTIFGESAGGAAVHLLYVSPLSKGLFHKAIAQSGCALNPWVRAQPSAKILAPVLNLDPSDEKSIYNALMKKSVEELHEIQEKASDSLTAHELRAFGIVVEKGSQEPAFLPDEPLKIIKEGKFNQVPFMLGFNTAEGLVFEFFKDPRRPAVPNPEEYIPWYLGYEKGSAESKALAEKILKFYNGDKDPSVLDFAKKIDIQSDGMFVSGIYATAVKQSRISKAPTYLYQMTVKTDLNFLRNLLKPSIPGVAHADDLGYLFKNFTTPEIKPESPEDVGLRRFVKLWTNFAKTGNPTPDKDDPLLKVVWKPVTSGEKVDYLDIGQELVLASDPQPERLKFWKDMFASSPAARRVDECAYPKCSR